MRKQLSPVGAWAAVFSAAACLSLGACHGDSANLAVQTPPQASGTPNPLATLAVLRVEGAPEAMEAKFRQQVEAEAAKSGVVMAPAQSAAYVARGYLSSYPDGEFVKLTYVWDVFDSSKRRAVRLNDEVVAKASGADPWTAMDDKAIAELAGDSARDLAAFLAAAPSPNPAVAAPAHAAIGAAARENKNSPALGYRAR